MGTTLTGTTPQDTYDSLIKVTDNGPLSGTAKYLSDGLGNDSVLALSNARVGVASTSPLAPLHIGNTTINNAAIGSSLVRLLSRSTANDVQEIGLGGEGSITMSAIGNIVTDGGSFAKGAIYFATRDVTTNTAPTERMRITSAGNVGIGTSSPNTKLHVSDAVNSTYLTVSGAATSMLFGSSAGGLGILGTTTNHDVSIRSNNVEVCRVTPNGLTFNGDTAAANALDDYEEGTWTMGITFGGGSAGITYNNNLGTYTKIGRQVTVNGWVNISAIGSSTGAARITGLPFTVANTDANYAGTAMACNKIAFANQLQAFAERGQNTILLTQVTEAGVESTVPETNFQVGSYAIISLTYFV